MTASSPYPPSIELATLYERTSGKGNKYITGYLGRAKLTLVAGQPTEDGTPTWKLLIAAAPPRQDAGKQASGTRTYGAHQLTTAPAPIRPDQPGAMFDDALDDIGRS